MAKFPVEIDDKEGIVEAINNLLSGPSGLGQNFAGFTSPVLGYYDDPSTDPPQAIIGYVTSNFRTPYTNTDPLTSTYVPSVDLKTAEMLDSQTIKFTYLTTQATPPFAVGNNPSVRDSSNDYYNGEYGRAGVVQSTTEFCIVRVTGDGTVQPGGDGGRIFLDGFGGNVFVSTDANAKVTVNGAGDRVFLSGNMNNILNYTTFEDSEFSVSFMINRYSGSPTNDPTNPEFSFDFDKTICVKTYEWATPVGSGTLPPLPATGSLQNQVRPLEPVFTAIIDQPGPGFYWYIFEIECVVTSGDTKITKATLFGRSLSAQVVKQ
jgi:hypothetical protein